MAIKKYHVSKQLFDKDNTTIYSAYINTSDAWVNDSGSYSIKIPCVGNTTYTLSVGLSLPIFRVYESSDNDVEPTSYGTGGTPISRITRGENLSQYTFTTAANSVYIIFQGSASALNDWINSLMLNTGSTALPYEPYGNSFKDWFYRKYGTETETFTSLPKTIIGDGQPISSYTIKGNMAQSGTPTPSNPVYPTECGDKTANLFDDHNVITIAGLGDRYGVELPSGTYSVYNDTDNIVYYGIDDFGSRQRACEPHSTGTFTLNIATGTVGGVFMPYNSASQGGCTVVEGSTPPDHYIPFGYEIPISLSQNTYNIYITEPLRKSLDGSNVFDTIESNGTLTRRVDANGDALATPTTEQVTVPTLTTTGTAEQFNVLTTLAPSEVSLTYHGWHEHEDTKFTT